MGDLEVVLSSHSTFTTKIAVHYNFTLVLPILYSYICIAEYLFMFVCCFGFKPNLPGETKYNVENG